MRLSWSDNTSKDDGSKSTCTDFTMMEEMAPTKKRAKHHDGEEEQHPDATGSSENSGSEEEVKAIPGEVTLKSDRPVQPGEVVITLLRRQEEQSKALMLVREELKDLSRSIHSLLNEQQGRSQFPEMKKDDVMADIKGEMKDMIREILQSSLTELSPPPAEPNEDGLVRSRLDGITEATSAIRTSQDEMQKSLANNKTPLAQVNLQLENMSEFFVNLQHKQDALSVKLENLTSPNSDANDQLEHVKDLIYDVKELLGEKPSPEPSHLPPGDELIAQLRGELKAAVESVQASVEAKATLVPPAVEWPSKPPSPKKLESGGFWNGDLMEEVEKMQRELNLSREQLSHTQQEMAQLSEPITKVPNPASKCEQSSVATSSFDAQVVAEINESLVHELRDVTRSVLDGAGVGGELTANANNHFDINLTDLDASSEASSTSSSSSSSSTSSTSCGSATSAEGDDDNDMQMDVGRLRNAVQRVKSEGMKSAALDSLCQEVLRFAPEYEKMLDEKKASRAVPTIGSLSFSPSNAPLDELNGLYRAEKVKSDIEQLWKQWQKPSGNQDKLGNILLEGARGTGKTTAIRVIVRVLHALGLLKSSKLVEARAHRLSSHKDRENLLNAAKGGVLYVREAFAAPWYASDCEALVVTSMCSDYDDVVICLAGTPTDIRRYPQIKSQCSVFFELADWRPEDCQALFEKHAVKDGIELGDGCQDVVRCGFTYLMEHTGWTNGHDVTKLWNEIKFRRANRAFAVGAGRVGPVNADDVRAILAQMRSGRSKKP